MDDQDETVKQKPVSGFLSIGNLRDLSLVALIVVLGYRLATADMSIELKDFSFTDLLSMFLAVSAIALSAAFYFKADESARSFYTNTYQFTKDVSESLGRIDSGFGERLKNIDQSYVGISNKLDRFTDPSYMASKAKAAKDVEEKEAEIQEQEARRDDVIQELMRHADMADAEKEKALAQIAAMSEELARSKAELQERRGSGVDFSGSQMSALLNLIYKYYSKVYAEASAAVIRKQFNYILRDRDFTDDLKFFLVDYGYLSDGKLSHAGVALVRDALNVKLDF